MLTTFNHCRLTIEADLRIDRENAGPVRHFQVHWLLPKFESGTEPVLWLVIIRSNSASNSIQVLAFADAIRRWPDLRRTIGYFSRPGLAWLFNVAQIQ